MNINKTRAIRAAIRSEIPAFHTGVVDDDSMSAALATLCELLAFRVMNANGQYPADAAVALVSDANDHVSGAMEKFLLKHLKDATMFRTFIPPKSGS
jgi:hypothetical protein